MEIGERERDGRRAEGDAKRERQSSEVKTCDTTFFLD